MLNNENDLNKQLYSRISTGSKSQQIDSEVPTEYGFGIRHTQSLLVFLCLLVAFMVRAHLSVTIVAMTSSDNLDKNVTNVTLNLNNDTDRERYNTTTTYDTWDVFRIYDWPKSVQEMALSSFHLGYLIMMLPLSAVCQKYGGKIPLQVALFVNGVSSIPVPWLIVWGDWRALCFIRILQGLSQAGLTPAIYALIAHWVPISERARIFSYVYTGTSIGTVVAFQISGVLAATSWGWPSVFWVTGLLNLVLFTVATLLVSSTPAQNKHITMKERNFILGRVDKGIKKRLKIPWRALVTSKPLWASFAANVCSGVTHVYCFNQVASYLHHALGVNIKNSGILSSLPYIATTCAGIFFGIISDLTINKNVLSLKTSRFLFNSFAHIGVALSVLLVSYTTSTTLAVICFIMTFIFFGAGYSGAMLSYVDMAPNYAGALTGMGNTLMCSCVLIVPVMVSHIITDMTNIFQWRIMFFFMAGLAFSGNLIYVMFGSVETQYWNNGYETTETDDPNQINDHTA